MYFGLSCNSYELYWTELLETELKCTKLKYIVYAIFQWFLYAVQISIRPIAIPGAYNIVTMEMRGSE